MATVTLEQLQAYIGTDESGDFIESCLSAGNALVGRYIGEVDTVPNDVHEQAILICSSEFFYRRQSPQGVTQFATMDGAPMRAAKDPMTAVYPLLAPFVSYAV